MSEMIDRVARAILQAAYPVEIHNERGQFDTLTDGGRDWYRAQARAAIEAMREPAAWMEDAGRDAADEDYDVTIAIGTPGVIWRAMIDEALK